MSANRVAVAVIHGQGAQGARPQDPDTISFSAALYKGLRARMGAEAFDASVAWREIFWADILQDRQDDYVRRALEGQAGWIGTRRFVMQYLSDAASYRWVSPDPGHVYQRIHARVWAALARLEQVAGGTTPLVLVAHSLGGHILSNYIWDMQRGRPAQEAASAFQRFDTMAGMVTFGCNIPVFTFAYPPEEVRPINRPGAGIPPGLQPRPWWINLNDRDDPLGMPLGPAGRDYGALVAAGELEDRWVRVGSLLSGWNPLSHNAYWADGGVQERILGLLRGAQAIGPVR